MCKVKNHGVQSTQNYNDEVAEENQQNWKLVDQRNFDKDGIISTERMGQKIFDFIKENQDEKKIFMSDILNEFNWIFGDLVMMGHKYIKLKNKIEPINYADIRYHFRTIE